MSETINIFKRFYFILGFIVVYIKPWTTLYKKETSQVQYIVFENLPAVRFSRICMEVHYVPSQFNNSDGNRVDLSCTCTYRETLGRSDIVISSSKIRDRGDTHGHNESPYEQSIEK
jgi:hypothetical protein